MAGQEHNATVYVSPTEYTIYTVVADSISRAKRCVATATVALNKASVVEARMMVAPDLLSVGNNPYRFADASTGEVTQWRWQFFENDFHMVKLTLNDSVVWYNVSENTDSLLVRLVVANGYGCTDSVDKIMRLADGDLWVPNAFTPDGHRNEVFRVGAYNITNYEISIYNRGGLLVFP